MCRSPVVPYAVVCAVSCDVQPDAGECRSNKCQQECRSSEDERLRMMPIPRLIGRVEHTMRTCSDTHFASDACVGVFDYHMFLSVRICSSHPDGHMEQAHIRLAESLYCANALRSQNTLRIYVVEVCAYSIFLQK